MPLFFDKFVLFGDSITEYSNKQDGFALAPGLQDLYSRKMDIVTRGFSGYNTDQGLVVLREVLKAENAIPNSVKLMYIFMGTNDAASTFQGVPVDRYRLNLSRMVQLAASQGIKVIVVGPALHDQALVSEMREERGEPEQAHFSSNENTRKYADTALEVAAENGVPFVDLWSEFQKYGEWSTEDLLANKPDLAELLVDGIHYTPKAYEVFYDALVETIVKHYPDLARLSLKLRLPYYRDVDYGNIEESLMKSMEE
ncbi:SGNH hydrolase [Metschnikowia bicuspidata var. bicuspidata NRRL YB-4993]|uniref:SGNH hydrolase n=1 Tax=Metschnikowia bicuspidata var. bicuspidata NRRL YB-4993 TaxID=869754 RepID=A0A1A0HGD4_9ASCO|nr:SGNH hydrolase [Metschnikowia bicuspidata var. bicuspidata NRRL YB-4993]OBA23066.1 SGNH hydrolase [Metschnikowia bicuspidata var. bicuspidata NRRL YB-4993]